MPDRTNSYLAREMDSLGERLNKTIVVTVSQMELNKNSESDMARLWENIGK